EEGELKSVTGRADMHGAELRITDEKGYQEVDGAVDPAFRHGCRHVSTTFLYQQRRVEAPSPRPSLRPPTRDLLSETEKSSRQGSVACRELRFAPCVTGRIRRPGSRG